MIRILISFGVAFVVAALVYLVLPDKMYVETAGNIIGLSFLGTVVLTWLILWRRARTRQCGA